MLAAKLPLYPVDLRFIEEGVVLWTPREAGEAFRCTFVLALQFAHRTSVDAREHIHGLGPVLVRVPNRRRVSIIRKKRRWAPVVVPSGRRLYLAGADALAPIGTSSVHKEHIRWPSSGRDLLLHAAIERSVARALKRDSVRPILLDVDLLRSAGCTEPAALHVQTDDVVRDDVLGDRAVERLARAYHGLDTWAQCVSVPAVAFYCVYAQASAGRTDICSSTSPRAEIWRIPPSSLTAMFRLSNILAVSRSIATWHGWHSATRLSG